MTEHPDGMLAVSRENIGGKLFIQFVALMYLSYIKKHMDDHDLFKSYTMQTLLDDLYIIEYYQQPGRAVSVGDHKETSFTLQYNGS